MAIIQKSFFDLVDFTRGSEATGWVNGQLKTFSINEPRFDHDLATGEAQGLLLEPQATNLVLWSEDFGRSQWLKDQGVTASNDSINFIGTDIAPNRSSPRIYQNIVLSSDKVGRSFVVTLIVPPVAYWSDPTAILRWGSALVGSPPPGGNITPTNDYQVLSFTVVPSVSGNELVPIAMNTDKDCTIIGLKCQFEENVTHSSSYIPTEDSQVTRAADHFSIVGQSFADAFNPNQGALVFKIGEGSQMNHVGSIAPFYAVALSSGFNVAAESYRGVHFSSGFVSNFNGIGVAATGPTRHSVIAKNMYAGSTVCISWSGDEIALAVDGDMVQRVTDPDLPAALAGADGLRINRALGIVLPYLKMYGHALTDAQMEALTEVSE